jgi:hypothetical protein
MKASFFHKIRMTKLCFWSLLFFAYVIVSSSFAVVVLDLDSGEYGYITEEEAKSRKEEEEKRRIQHQKEKAISELKSHRPRISLPESYMSKESWEKEIEKHPWKEWKFYENGIVTNDFVNTSPNVLLINFLDYEGAAKDGVTDINVIREKYVLCCVLYPGDKYVETRDGKNGVRLAQYKQVHEYCEEEKKYCGLKIMDNDRDGDGIPSWDEVKGTNIVVKYRNCSSNIFVFTSMWSKDTDRDGINDNDEIRGTNGYVTDPMDPDTDGDGIPDGVDKYPTYSCESADPAKMPAEWAEYWSRDKKEFYDKLLLADADPDGDGFTNKEEKKMDLDPTWPNREIVIIFPKRPTFRNVKGNKYEGYINFLINTNVLTEVQIWTAPWQDLMRYSPYLKYLGSVPLREKVFKRKEFFDENIRDSKTHNIFAVVQPMTVHKFKVTYKKEGFLKDIGFTVDCRKYPYKKDFTDYKDLGIKHVDFVKYYSRFWLKDYPTPPKLLKPKPDHYFLEDGDRPLEWSDSSHVKFPWKGDALINVFGSFNVLTEHYLGSYSGGGYFSCYGFNPDKLYCNTKYEFETYAIAPCLSAAGVSILGEYTPIFKTRRLNLDSSFVYKPDTMWNIRLQARYGKEGYKEVLDKIREYEEKLAELSK